MKSAAIKLGFQGALLIRRSQLACLSSKAEDCAEDLAAFLQEAATDKVVVTVFFSGLRPAVKRALHAMLSQLSKGCQLLTTEQVKADKTTDEAPKGRRQIPQLGTWISPLLRGFGITEAYWFHSMNCCSLFTGEHEL